MTRRIGLFFIVWRSLRNHLLSTIITVFSTALASGLVLAVFAINAQTYNAFTGGPMGFDAVLGARGSQLQLVLNSVFHLETSPGNIPWSLYKSIQKDPRVALAVPYAVGDNYKGYRLVGTTGDIFTKLEYQKGRKFEMQGGRAFDESRREAVLGSYVAQRTGLRVGSKINPYHGLVYAEDMKHDEEYVIVGIMKPTNSPADRVIWIPIEGIFRMEGHVLRGSGKDFKAAPGEAIPEEHREVSSVMLKLKSPQSGMMLDQKINRQGKVATLAWPISRVMADLFDKMGWVNRVLRLVAYLVMVVAAASILASIYNTLNERRREFAILRALGARRRTVFSVITLEAAVISALGALFGFVVFAIIVLGAAQVVRAQTGVVLDAFQFHRVMIWGPLGMIALGALAGLVPATKAYATDVATNLTPAS